MLIDNDNRYQLRVYITKFVEASPIPPAVEMKKALTLGPHQTGRPKVNALPASD